jgi:hypothetical protein
LARTLYLLALKRKEAVGEGANRDMRGACAPQTMGFRRRDADGGDRDGQCPIPRTTGRMCSQAMIFAALAEDLGSGQDLALGAARR